MRIFIGLLLASAVGVMAEASPRAARLEALSQIETGDNDRAVGGAGEVSRYQIKPWIWRQYSDSEAYDNRAVSTRVAEQHLAGLASTFRKCTRREPTDFDLYVLWNAGPTYYHRIGFAKARVHPVIRDRARRYANLREALDATPAQTARTTASPATTKSATPALPVGAPETLSLSPIPPSAPLASQQRVFSLVPLSPQPDTTPAGQQTLFAVGGIQAK